MKFFILTSLFTIVLFAQSAVNPKVYQSLGDEIYDNISKIETLKQLKQYEGFIEKIDTYAKKVQKTKDFGYQVESGARANLKLDYLSQIREHKKVNDSFVRSAHNALQSALDTKNDVLFIGVVNSGLIDARANKKKILNYYKAHSDTINPEGIIQTFLDEDKNKKRWRGKTKKELQAEKVARLRKNDKLDEEALEEKLANELREKKRKIRAKQERELFR